MDQPTLTPGSNGYLAPQAQTNWTNPWSGMASSDQNAAPANAEQAQKNIGSMQNQYNAYSKQSSAYPSFSNSFGLGSQNAFSSSPGAATTNSAPPPQADPRAINPWILQGEANAR